MVRRKVLSLVLAIAVMLSYGAVLPKPTHAQPDEDACKVVETGVYYATLGEALTSVGNDQTVQLLKSVTYSESIVANGKNLTIDLNGHDLTVENAAGNALVSTNTGALNISDGSDKASQGVLTVTSSGEYKQCVYAVSGGTVNIAVASNITASIPSGAPSYQDVIAAYAAGAGSAINLVGNVSGTMAGIYVQNGADITVTGNVAGGFYGAFAAYGGKVSIAGDILAGTRGLEVGYGGEAQVQGNITGTTAICAQSGTSWAAPKARITGNAVGIGGSAIDASDDADIEITGDLRGYVAVSGNDETAPKITVNGNIEVSSGFGVSVYYGGTVTVNGAITGADPYLKLNESSITEGSGDLQEGYYVYSNVTPSAYAEKPDLVNTVKVKAPEPVTVSLLEIADAIAPVNGKPKATAIAGTDQYTGILTWDGTPGTFSPGQTYTAIITLTAKEGYTFNGVAEDAFEVPCAMSATNGANSGVITATFISPPAGYVTDGHGVMAYAYGYSDWDYINTFDIKGFFHSGWKGTTYNDYGYGTEYKEDSDSSYIAVTGGPVAMGDTGLTMGVDFAFVSNGRALQVRYTLKNEGSGSKTVSFGSHADIQIGSDDSAPISILDDSLPVSDNRGFKMVSRSDGNGKGNFAQFNFFGKRSVGVTDVDTFWYGHYGSRYSNVFAQVGDSSCSGDSGMAYSWQNRTIGVGETQVYTVVIGIGGAESSEVLGYSVAYDDNASDAVISVPETQQKIENVALELSRQIPIRSGYQFGGWNTAPDGSGTSYNPGDIYTQNANLVLYASWRKAEPASETVGSYISYTITATAREGGEISPSGKVIVDEWLDKPFTITPATGYVISDVLVDGESVGALSRYVFTHVTRSHTIEAIFAPRRDHPFEDVRENDWFFEPTLYVYYRGLLLGTGGTTFEPQGIATRAMIPTILYRMEGKPSALRIAGFPDVEYGLWYSDAIMWSAGTGIVLGLEDGTFAPNLRITREQLAAMLYRYAGYKGWDVKDSGDLSAFTDVANVSPWALEAVRWAVGSGLVRGKGGGVLDPLGPATRAEVATILMNLLGKYDAGF